MVEPRLLIEPGPISTWFGIGGSAARLAQPCDAGAVRACVEMDPMLRVLGDGANLLVDDDGVDGLVLDTRRLNAVHWDMENARVVAQAGVNLPWLIIEAVRRGLGGIEGLAGIPASVGGATIMNAGGAFGEMADVVASIEAIDRDGRTVTLERDEIAFGYRRSGLNHLIITQIQLHLTPCPENGTSAHERWRTALRDRLKETMAYKKRTQPMAADSAGCVFKNPTLDTTIEDIGEQGGRVSAGMLIDRAGCRGLGVGGATVSKRHANFIVTQHGARARDVMDLMALVTQRVHDAHGVTLAAELVLWRNDP